MDLVVSRKQKTCKICKSKFTPTRDLQPVCSTMSCMIEYSNKHLKKQYIKKNQEATKKKKEFYKKDVTTMKMKAQAVFNRYIRTRDKGNSCISCMCEVVKGDASHFFSVGGHSAVRFHTDNVHLSCYKCNRFLHGNLENYKPRLLEKIGEDRFNKLQELSKTTKKYDTRYCQRVIDIFNKKIKRLNKS